MGNTNLPGGDNIQPQPLLPKDQGQSLIDKGFAGIENSGISIALAKLLLKLATPASQAEFVKEIKRCAKLSG